MINVGRIGHELGGGTIALIWTAVIAGALVVVFSGLAKPRMKHSAAFAFNASAPTARKGDGPPRKRPGEGREARLLRRGGAPDTAP